jgi:hypothetical protein
VYSSYRTFHVIIFVDAHFIGVGGRIGVTGAFVRIGASWREGLDVDEGTLGARRGTAIGVNILGDNIGKDALENLKYSFRGPDFLELREAIGVLVPARMI